MHNKNSWDFYLRYTYINVYGLNFFKSLNRNIEKSYHIFDYLDILASHGLYILPIHLSNKLEILYLCYIDKR